MREADRVGRERADALMMLAPGFAVFRCPLDGSRVRLPLHEPRPETLDVCGLGAALEELMRSYKESDGSCTFSFAQDSGMPKITGELATQGYRLVQESLTNVVKHSQATYVAVFARCDEGQLQLSVRDDGVGFDVQRQSLGVGLSNMRERVASLGGHMEIRSRQAEGTTLLFTLPLQRVN